MRRDVAVGAFGLILLVIGHGMGLFVAPAKRLTVSAVATILAYVDVPIVYMSIKWWRTLHQNFSSPETVSSTMVLPLRISAFGMLFLSLGFAMFRKQLALRRLEAEDAE